MMHDDLCTCERCYLSHRAAPTESGLRDDIRQVRRHFEVMCVDGVPPYVERIIARVLHPSSVQAVDGDEQ